MNDKFSAKILGIDYGRKKVGIAISEGFLAEPLLVIRYSDIKILEGQIEKIIKEEKIEKVVVGISEGRMAEEIKKFVSTIRYSLSPITCEVFDETLTSKDAQKISLESGISQKKRHEMEDAYAATIMLQNYLDSRR